MDKKELEARMGKLMFEQAELLNDAAALEATDKRGLAIARTHIETGMLWLSVSIAGGLHA